MLKNINFILFFTLFQTKISSEYTDKSGLIVFSMFTFGFLAFKGYHYINSSPPKFKPFFNNSSSFNSKNSGVDTQNFRIKSKLIDSQLSSVKEQSQELLKSKNLLSENNYFFRVKDSQLSSVKEQSQELLKSKNLLSENNYFFRVKDNVVNNNFKTELNYFLDSPKSSITASVKSEYSDNDLQEVINDVTYKLEEFKTLCNKIIEDGDTTFDTRFAVEDLYDDLSITLEIWEKHENKEIKNFVSQSIEELNDYNTQVYCHNINLNFNFENVDVTEEYKRLDPLEIYDMHLEMFEFKIDIYLILIKFLNNFDLEMYSTFL